MSNATKPPGHDLLSAPTKTMAEGLLKLIATVDQNPQKTFDQFPDEIKKDIIFELIDARVGMHAFQIKIPPSGAISSKSSPYIKLDRFDQKLMAAPPKLLRMAQRKAYALRLDKTPPKHPITMQELALPPSCIDILAKTVLSGLIERGSLRSHISAINQKFNQPKGYENKKNNEHWFFIKHARNLSSLINAVMNKKLDQVKSMTSSHARHRFLACALALSNNRAEIFDLLKDELSHDDRQKLFLVATRAGNVEAVKNLLHHASPITRLRALSISAKDARLGCFDFLVPKFTTIDWQKLALKYAEKEVWGVVSSLWSRINRTTLINSIHHGRRPTLVKWFKNHFDVADAPVLLKYEKSLGSLLDEIDVVRAYKEKLIINQAVSPHPTKNHLSKNASTTSRRTKSKL